MTEESKNTCPCWLHLLEAAKETLKEYKLLNPYNRHDIRFVSKAETTLRKAVDACLAEIGQKP